MKSKIIEKKNYILIAVILFSIIVYTLLNSKTSFNIRSLAEDADPNFCQNYCTGKDRCSQSSSSNPSDPNYNDPCCEEIKKTGSPYACPWPQRGYCTDDQCASIPEGVSRERCGVPRHSWCNKCIDNNCPGYGTSLPTVTPAVQPTSPPQPTTPIPIPSPTQSIIQPTQSNIVPTSLINPTTPPVPTIPQPQTFTFPTSYPTQQTNFIEPNLPIIHLPSFPSFQFPKLNFSQLKPQIDTQKINETVAKPLGFFEYLFERVTYYDKKLENKINDQIIKILPAK